MQLIDFLSPEQMEQYINESSFIITHGGVGTIIHALDLNKKIIAVPRLKKYKEHVNDHQLQIIENFDKSGYILGANQVEDIKTLLHKIELFIPNKFISNNKKFLEKLEENV